MTFLRSVPLVVFGGFIVAGLFLIKPKAPVPAPIPHPATVEMLAPPPLAPASEVKKAPAPKAKAKAKKKVAPVAKPAPVKKSCAHVPRKAYQYPHASVIAYAEYKGVKGADLDTLKACIGAS